MSLASYAASRRRFSISGCFGRLPSIHGWMARVSITPAM
jgi:hypothetical protein